MKKLRFLVPNAITLSALACGMLAIAEALAGEPLVATWWIITGTVLDGLDGMVARLLEAQTEIGGQLDSFSDFATFGVAPPVVLLAALQHVTSFALLVAVGLVYTICCAIRLAQFNLTEMRGAFRGMPSPMAAGVFSLVLLLTQKYQVDLARAAVPLCVLMILFSGAMICPWLRYRKLGHEQWRILGRINAVLVLSCWILIFLRLFPEYLIVVSGTAAVVGPVVARLGNTVDHSP